MISVSRLLKYLAYAIVLFGFLFIFDPLLITVRNTGWPYNLTFVYLMQMVFGFLLGLEHLVRQFRQGGRWRVQVEKMVFLGLPSLALYVFFLLYYGHIISIAPENAFFRTYGMQIGLLQVYVGVILGYTLATAFLKVGDKQQ